MTNIDLLNEKKNVRVARLAAKILARSGMKAAEALKLALKLIRHDPAFE